MNSTREVVLKNGKGISLRTYSPEDKERLISIYASLSPEAIRWGLPPYDIPRIERWTSDLANTIILVALSEETIVGHSQIFLSASPRLKGIGELAIYLHQDFQSLGLGFGMMKEILELARRNGLPRVGLRVVADNKRAIRLYEKVGFKHEGILKHSYFGANGLYHDDADMGIIV